MSDYNTGGFVDRSKIHIAGSDYSNEILPPITVKLDEQQLKDIIECLKRSTEIYIDGNRLSHQKGD